jgi:hypothetical protein
MANSDNSSPPPVEPVDQLAELRRKRGAKPGQPFVLFERHPGRRSTRPTPAERTPPYVANALAEPPLAVGRKGSSVELYLCASKTLSRGKVLVLNEGELWDTAGFGR